MSFLLFIYYTCSETGPILCCAYCFLPITIIQHKVSPDSTLEMGKFRQRQVQWLAEGLITQSLWSQASDLRSNAIFLLSPLFSVFWQTLRLFLLIVSYWAVHRCFCQRKNSVMAQNRILQPACWVGDLAPWNPSYCSPMCQARPGNELINPSQQPSEKGINDLAGRLIGWRAGKSFETSIIWKIPQKLKKQKNKTKSIL